MGQCFDWDPKSSGQSEICKLDVAVFVHQDVLWLQVSVHNSVRVSIVDSLDNLVDHLFHRTRAGRTFEGYQVFLQIVSYVLKYQIESVNGIQHFLELYHIGVAKPFE